MDKGILPKEEDSVKGLFCCIRRWLRLRWWFRWLKRLPTMPETQFQSLGQEDLLEKEMATHSSILAWKLPWTEEPGRLQSMGSQRVRHDWATSLSLFSLNSTGRQPGGPENTYQYQSKYNELSQMDPELTEEVKKIHKEPKVKATWENWGLKLQPGHTAREDEVKPR